MIKNVFKRDMFRRKRGNYSRFLDIYCRKCDTLLLTYQKDGPGNLRRLYLDRIFSPESLINLQNKSLKEIPSLKCRNCKEQLGIPYIYKKENRKSYRLFQDAVVKKIRKLKLDN